MQELKFRNDQETREFEQEMMWSNFDGNGVVIVEVYSDPLAQTEQSVWW